MQLMDKYGRQHNRPSNDNSVNVQDSCPTRYFYQMMQRNIIFSNKDTRRSFNETLTYTMSPPEYRELFVRRELLLYLLSHYLAFMSQP